jgi:hypothetical protein
MTCPDSGGLDRLTREISVSKEFQYWPAGKARSGPISHTDGSVEATWILLPPQQEDRGAPANDASTPGGPP